MVKSFLISISLFVMIFSITLVVINEHQSLARVQQKPSEKQVKTLHHKKEAQNSEQKIGLQVGNIAPGLMLKNLNGERVKLSDFRGKEVLLNFWASWCTPCQEEIPELVKFYSDANRNKIAILSVNMTSMEQGGNQAIANFAQKYGMLFPILLDKTADAEVTYGVLTIPTTYLINAQGIIFAKHIGPVTEKWIDKQIMK